MKCIVEECKHFITNSKGIVLVEYALILPSLLVIMAAVVQFGVFLLKWELTVSRVHAIELAIQNDPVMTPNEFNALVTSTNNTFLSFNATDPNTYICARASLAAQNVGGQSYPSTTLPQENTICPPASSPNPLETCTPVCTAAGYNGVTALGNPPYYYVTVDAHVSNADSTMNPFRNFIPAVSSMTINYSSGWTLVAAARQNPPACTGTGKFLQYNPTLNPPWQCVEFGSNTPVPNCYLPWQKFVLQGGTFTCVTIPYVVASGNETMSFSDLTSTAPDAIKPYSDLYTCPGYPNNLCPGISNCMSWSPGSTCWEIDTSFVPWMTTGNLPYVQHNRTTLCKDVSFSVPAGIPAPPTTGPLYDNANFVGVGTLTYPGGGGTWNSWVASIQKIIINNTSAPIVVGGGGNYYGLGYTSKALPTVTVPPLTGMASVCMSNGGNWVWDFVYGGTETAWTNTENVSWSIIYLPNGHYQSN